MRSQRKIKIAFLNDSSRIGGAERSLALLIRNLNHKLFETLVICPKEGPFIEELERQNINVIPMDINHFSRKHRPFNYIISLFKLLYIIRRLKVDIIHCNSIRAAHWGVPIGKILSKKTFCHIRSSDYTKFSSFIVRSISKDSEFIAISKFVKKSLRDRGVLDNKITIIYNGVDDDLYSPYISLEIFEREFPIYKKVLKIGIIGRIEDWKRHIDVIEATGIIKKDIDFHLFIVGEVWNSKDFNILQTLKSRIIDLELENRVTFTGFRRDIPELIAGLDVIIVPSINEPFGRVTIEAMAIGKPVIGTISGCTPEVIQDGINGILVPVKDPAAIAKAIQYLANNPEHAARLGREARKRVVETFSIRRHVMLVQNLYMK